MYVLNAGHGKAFDVSYVRIVNIVSGIPEHRTDIYGHVRMGIFSGIGASLMKMQSRDNLTRHDGLTCRPPTYLLGALGRWATATRRQGRRVARLAAVASRCSTAAGGIWRFNLPRTGCGRCTHNSMLIINEKQAGTQVGGVVFILRERDRNETCSVHTNI